LHERVDRQEGFTVRKPGLLGITVAGLLITALATAAPGEASGGHAKAVLCHGKRATIVGTRHDDRLVGTSGRDVIVGLKGDDRIIGKGGADWICGKSGYDRLYPGDGSDHVGGGRGGDTIYHSAGDDEISGGRGRTDVVDYGNARSRVQVDAGKGVAMVGGTERDRFGGLDYYFLTPYADRFSAGATGAGVYSGDGDDVIAGGPGNDFLDGGPGDDRVDGGRGTDNLKGDVGADRLTDLHGRSYVWDGAPKRHDRGGVIRTGSRRDEFFIYPGRHQIDSGAGDDMLTIRGGQAGSVIATGDGDDVVLSRDPYRSGPMTLRMQNGDDTFACTGVACGGDSKVYGGPGANVVDLWQAIPAVTAVLGPVGSLVIHGDTERALSLFAFVDITTGDGEDVITGTDDANTIISRDGDDTIKALGGDDLVNAEGGADTADGGEGDDQCFGVETPTNCETVG
jgi:Ca2+-binding RTX toxin-like protein